MITPAVKCPWKPVMRDVKTVAHVGFPKRSTSSAVAVPVLIGGGVGSGFVYTAVTNPKMHKACFTDDAMAFSC